MQNPLPSAPPSPFGPVQTRRTPRSTAHHARFYHYQPPVLLTLTPSHQSKPIGHTLRSGLVQNIFSSPARLVYVFALLTPTCRHAAKLKMLCLVETLPTREWDAPRDYVMANNPIRATPKKFIIHILVHEIRHWAQIATVLRMDGLKGDF